jgi:hypothetical protein
MKKIYTLMAAILIVATGWAQSPQKISYQAVIRDAGDVLVTTQVGMRISILQGSGGGTPVYVETFTPTPNINGLVSIEIGGGDPVAFAAIDWSDGPYFIKTETAVAPPLTTYTITGASELLSVPYALYAKSSGERFIGEYYGGGIIVSVWKAADGVQHGLIASLVNLQPDLAGIRWSDILTATNGRSPIDGQANTNAILAVTGTEANAAKLCADYTNPETGTGVYSDWYLPAIYELNKIYQAALIVNKILPPSDELSFKTYWSSTESSATTAYYHAFHTDIVGSNGAKETVLAYVRAVRAF